MYDTRGPQPLHAAAVYFLMLLIAVLLAMAGQLIGGMGEALLRITAMQWAGLLALAVVLPLAALSPAQALKLKAVRPGLLLAGLMSGLGLATFIAATLARLYSFGDGEEYAREVGRVLSDAQAHLGTISLLLSLMILAPVAEELVFRGAILSGLRARFPAWSAVALSSGLFAILHMHPAHFSITFLLGLLAAWFVVRTGSIWPAIVLHAGYNGGAMLMDVLGFPQILPLWTILPALLMMGVGVYLASRSRSAKE